MPYNKLQRLLQVETTTYYDLSPDHFNPRADLGSTFAGPGCRNTLVWGGDAKIHKTQTGLEAVAIQEQSLVQSTSIIYIV